MQSVQNISHSLAPLIQPLPNEIAISVFEFLDPKTVVLTIRVCKAWRDNLEMNNRLRKTAFDRIEESIELSLYPQEMVRLFRDRKIPIFKLPVFNLKERTRGAEYFGLLEIKDMPSPIMRFIDKFDRPGIAFYLEHHIDGQVQKPELEDEALRSISGVFAVYKRHINGDTWRVGMSGVLYYMMSKLHIERHYANGHVGSPFIKCPNCPKGMSSGEDVNYTLLANLLDASDPLFKIAKGYTPVARSSLQAPTREEEKETSKIKK